MSLRKVILISTLVATTWCFDELVFPPDFKFGASSSAYQIEGGWNAGDKGESIWDHFSHKQPSQILDGSTGDIACDSYHLWERDIQMAVELGLHHYRFSISWPRLLPSGHSNHISEDGRLYYSNLINGLLARGIEPILTLYHFDLPQSIQDYGGWTNPLIAEWFADYSRVVFSLYADRVKTWITINEPMGICDGGYGSLNAPGISDLDISLYLCTKHILLAHAKAWRIYDEEFKPKYHGRVTLSNMFFWYEPLDKKFEGITNMTLEFCEQRFSHAIYTEKGGWPPALEKLLLENSIRKGFKKSRLPPFTKDEIELVKGTYDFYGLNNYNTLLVRKAKPDEEIGDWPIAGSTEVGAVFQLGRDWKTAAPSWFGVYPEGIRHQLNWIREHYGNVSILITENGYPSNVTGLNDYDRIEYMRGFLKQIWLAIHEDGINLEGYTVWSIMDNFELTHGYTIKYGLYEVDFNSTKRTRTPRDSAKFYADVIASRILTVPV